jgi:hypothetical protein
MLCKQDTLTLDDIPRTVQRREQKPNASRYALEINSLSAHEDPTQYDGEEQNDKIDEETRRKEELRARMARLGGGMPGPGAPVNRFGAPPHVPPEEEATIKRAKTKRE